MLGTLPRLAPKQLEGNQFAPRGSALTFCVEALFNDVAVRRFGDIEPVARRKLLYLHRARVLDDLKAPPGNRLEALKGDRRGLYSNPHHTTQWRVCFTWRSGDAHDVEIVDDH